MVIFANDWMQKLRFSGLVVRKISIVNWWWIGCNNFRYEIDSWGKTNRFMVENFVTWFAIILTQIDNCWVFLLVDEKYIKSF